MKPHESDPDHVQHVMTFVEWYSRFVITVYGNVDPGFQQWPFDLIHESLVVIFNSMKQDQKNKCAHFALEFSCLLYSAISLKNNPCVKTEEVFKSHLEQLPGTFPEIKIDLKSGTLDSVIIGVSRILMFFRKNCNTPYMDKSEICRILDTTFTSSRNDVREVIRDLFLTCSDCKSWNYDYVKNFVDAKFGPLLNLDTQSILNNSPEFTAYIEVMIRIIERTRTKAWVESFLLLLIKMAWIAPAEIRSKVKMIVLSIGSAIDNRPGLGPRMFRKHSDFLLTELIEAFIAEEANDMSPEPVGRILRNVLELFDFTPSDIENSVLHPILIKVLLLDRAEANDVFIDILNEFVEIRFKSNTKYFPSLISSLIGNLKWPSIENAVSFLAKLWKVNDGWAVLFNGDSNNVIVEVMLQISSQRDIVCCIAEKYVTFNNTRMRADRSDKFIKTFIEHFDLMKSIILVVGQNVFSQSRDLIMKNKTIIESLMILINIVGSSGVAPIQTTLGSFVKKFMQYECLSLEEFAIVADLYYVYLNNLGKAELEANLDHLCKDLVLLLPKAPSKTVEALKLVILDKGLSDKAIGRLSFLPLNHPALESLYQKFEQVVQAMKRESNDITVKVVKLSDDALEAQELDMKQVRLEILCRFIKKHYNELTKGGDYSSYWITKVFSNLIADSRIPDKVIRKVVAECMGQIGAIDPARFEQIPFSGSEVEISTFDVNSNAFSTQLLGRLGEFVVKTTDFDCKMTFFKTIRDLQEILSSDQVRFAISQLPVNSQKQIEEASKYKSKARFAIFSEIEGLVDKPIFTPEINYEEWLRKWSKKMIKVLSPSSKERQIFECCAALFNSDYRLAEMLLPCIVFHLLSSRTVSEVDKRLLVDNEIQTVIKSAIPFSAHMSTFEASSPLESRITVSAISLNSTQHSCAQQIFVLFDRLSQERNSLPIRQSLEKMSFLHLAHLAYGCQSYARSLSYLEQHYHDRTKSEPESKREMREDEIHLLQKIYVALDDPDGVDGVDSTRKTEPDIMDRILVHEAKNNLESALTCCEIGVQCNPDNVDYCKMMLRCMLSLDQPSNALFSSIGSLVRKPDWKSKIKPYMIEATWKLGNWDELDTLTKGNGDDEGNTSQSIGRLLICVKERDSNGFKVLLDRARVKEMNPISAMASQRAAYLRSYQHLVRLHMLTDLEQASTCLFDTKPGNIEDTLKPEDLNPLWIQRNESILPSLRTLEPVLSLQRVIYNLACSGNRNDQDKFSVELASSLLLSAKIARRSGNVERAHSCLLGAQRHMETEIASRDLNLVSEFLIETTKREWVRGDSESKEKAVEELSRGISKHFGKYLTRSVGRSPAPIVPVVVPRLSTEFVRALAKAKLLWIRMTDQMETLEKSDVVQEYREVINIDDKWEKPYFHLAKLYDRIASSEGMEGSEKTKNQHMATSYYFDSLKQGCKYSQESLPRLLEIWFDMALEGRSLDPSSRSSKKSNPTSVDLEATSKFVEALGSNIPLYVLYTGFSQMMSRFNHPNPEVAKVLTTLITKLVCAYPKQVMWRLMVYHFLPQDQRLRYHHVLTTISNYRQDQFLRMAEVARAFIHLSSATLPFHGNHIISYLSPSDPIVKVFNKHHPIPVLLPSEKFMRVTLPPSGLNESSHLAFEPNEVYINDINKKVTILSSLAKPKKISLITSNGQSFTMMVKPKDDLRFDSRFLEFCDVVNRLLKKDPETRKRRLRIRTFAVVPLSCDAGLVEWVDGLRDIRGLLLDAYEKYRGLKNTSVKEEYPNKSLSASTAVKKFQHGVMPRFKPPVFREWFVNEFPDATSWHLARNNYVRTTAVMSMVGYVIGLGDRHLENILLDVKSGEVVHVDFNCLFNRGEKLEVPEIVPFRLTHNMVDAMGLTGYEGHFRRTCEETMRVMRAHCDMLMSVLNPFVFDPFVGVIQAKSKKQPGRRISTIVDIPPSGINHEVSLYQLCYNLVSLQILDTG